MSDYVVGPIPKPGPPPCNILPTDEVYEVHAAGETRTELLAKLYDRASDYYGPTAPIRFIGLRVSWRDNVYHGRALAVRRHLGGTTS